MDRSTLSWRQGWGLAITSVGILTIILIEGYRRWVPPDGISHYKFLFGEKGLLEISISAGTLLAGIITVALLFQRSAVDRKQIEISIQNSRLSQFKEGATLLAHEKQSAAINGMLLLASLGAQVPERFLVPVARALSAFVHECGLPQWSVFAEAIRSNTPAPPAKPSPMSVVSGMSLIGSLRVTDKNKKWPSGLGYIDGRLRMQQVFLGDMTLATADYSNMEMIDFIVWRTHFERVDLSNSELDWRVVDAIQFRECDLSGAKITLRTLAGATALNVIVRGCNVKNATINGMPAISVDN